MRCPHMAARVVLLAAGPYRNRRNGPSAPGGFVESCSRRRADLTAHPAQPPDQERNRGAPLATPPAMFIPCIPHLSPAIAVPSRAILSATGRIESEVGGRAARSAVSELTV